MTVEPLAFDVLRSREEIREARKDLRRHGWVDFGSPLERSATIAAIRHRLGHENRRFGLLPDPIKSWDVLRAARAVQLVAEPDTPVLDMGSVGCPVLPCLHAIGYTQLHGLDLDPRVMEMPLAGEIDYQVADMTSAPWPDGTFAAITAISVIEHGYAQDALLDEVARLLRPGGAFIFSTDYWPQKLSTDGISLFGLDWRIFSADEIEQLIAAAGSRGLHPVRDPGAILRAPPQRENGARPISYEGRDYTFLYGVLRRDGEAPPAGGG
jgi:SAM-dependent methyltransferase